MKNVLIKQSKTFYIGITQTAIDTSSVNYGHYTVPLEIRNTKYPTEFRDLPNEQINFPLIDDEVPLFLGDKIDYKDYITFTDTNGHTHFAIVNPVPRKVIEVNSKYKTIGQVENGQILPPPYKVSGKVKLQIPRISLSTSNIKEESKMLEHLNLSLSVPIIVPFTIAENSYAISNIDIPMNTEVIFQLVQYQGIFKKEIKFAAVNVSPKSSSK